VEREALDTRSADEHVATVKDIESGDRMRAMELHGSEGDLAALGRLARSGTSSRIQRTLVAEN